MVTNGGSAAGHEEVGAMLARDIMTAHPTVVTPDDPILLAAEMMRDRHVGALPVIEDLQSRRLAGIITARDIVARCLAEKHGEGCRVRDHMTHAKLEWVTPDSEVDTVVEKMTRAQVRRIPVVDGARGLIGIVAVTDIALRLRLGHPSVVEELERMLSLPTP
ncbi:MAG: CBS domain-containing protein [Gemmatimonadetes bacterium]|nr:CBS domain-containing protein [Gemmatimonadota bacterium]